MYSFSVLLSLYCRELPANLRESLDSIFMQTVKPSEVVLVEDGPLTDELYSVVSEYEKKYPEIKVVPLPKNVGLGKALNEGLKHCSYELIARMDTDDVCKPFRFERQLKLFKEHPEIDVCSSWIDEFIGNTNNVVSQRRLPETNDEIIRYAKTRCPINHPAVMYKRSKIIEVGGYQGFPEDLYLWVKLIMNGAVFHNIQQSLVFFRTSEDVYKRRGGWKYAKDDVRAQFSFYKMGFLSFADMNKNIVVRVSVRLMPNNIRSYLYKKLLRNKDI